MTMTRAPVHASRPPAVVAALVVVGLSVAACSSDDGGAGAPATGAGDDSPATATADAATTTSAPPASATTVATTADPSVSTTTTTTATTVATTTTVTLPERGVPGLDSEVVVCRAWSRFGGSFQVAAVAASFGGDALDAARLEVVAAPVVAEAYAEMVASWPDELADEAELVADGFLGPYARRSARALDALAAAGASDDELDELAELWLDALSVRDPAEVVPDLELPTALHDLVDRAASAFDAQVVPIPLDPSLVSDVDVPRSEEFLLETCPDRGTLGGTEIVG